MASGTTATLRFLGWKITVVVRASASFVSFCAIGYYSLVLTKGSEVVRLLRRRVRRRVGEEAAVLE